MDEARQLANERANMTASALTTQEGNQRADASLHSGRYESFAQEAPWTYVFRSVQRLRLSLPV